jgi:lysophospholipase L1-like esterase
MAISLSACLLLSELVLRGIFPFKKEYYIWPPHLQRIFNPSPAIMPGIKGESRFIINSMGIRGDEISPRHTYRILAVGGSTTECLYLDQAETWTQLLQQKLNENTRTGRVWVGNAGKGGLNTREHILQLRYLFSKFSDLDAVIVLAGINDLNLRLKQDEGYDPHFLERPEFDEQLIPRVFSVVPIEKDPAFYKRTALWDAARSLRRSMFGPAQNVQDDSGKSMIKWRALRKNAKVIRHALPDLASALKEYARNLNLMIDLSRNKSVRLIFLTQPVMWKPGLPQELQDLMWSGGVGNFREAIESEFYSVEALAAGMQMYNEKLKEVCRSREVECFDLASRLPAPQDTTVFYDHCHFNENGAKEVANAVAHYMLERGPWANASFLRKSL